MTVDLVHAIKQRLNNLFYREGQPSAKGFCSQLEKKYNIRLNDKTLASTLQLNNEQINAMVLIGMCKYYGVDANFIISDPAEGIELPDINPAAAVPGVLRPLSDRAYQGIYHTYLLPRSDSAHAPVCGVLHIEISDKETSVLLTIQEKKSPEEVARKTFKGNLYFSEKSRNAFALLYNSEASFCFLSFSYEPFSYSRTLNFKLANFVSYSVDEAKAPRMQKMILSRQEIQDPSVLRGLMKFGGNHLVIEKTKLKELCAKDETINRLIEENQNRLLSRECVLIDYPFLMKSGEHEDGSLSLKEVLAISKMIDKSMAPPAEQVSCPEVIKDSISQINEWAKEQ